MRTIDAYLTPNLYSRSTIRIVPRGLVVHWIGVAGQRAEVVREYFEARKWGHSDYGSAHDIIDLDGTVVHCIPYEEEAYHAGDNFPNYAHEAIRLFGPNPNRATIGIEMCHPDGTGRPTSDTLMAAIEVCVSMCRIYQIDPLTRIWLHSHVTGKGTPWGIQTAEGPCHKWFYDNADEWAAFKATVAAEVEHAA